MREGNFYEDDEPIEKILAILDRPTDFVTAPPPGVRMMHCIACRKKLKPVFDSLPDQPNDALIFSSAGTFGSKIFDPMDSSCLVVYLCDACVEAASHDDAVQFRPRSRPAEPRPLEIWRP